MPSTISAGSPASPAIRAARDRFFDRFFSLPKPLTADYAPKVHMSEGSTYRTSETPIPEVPDFPGRVIVTGTFTSHDSVLSATKRSLYSEVHIKVDKIVAPGDLTVEPGQDIVVLVAGGTVKTADGEIISFLTQPRRFSLQPNHQYLLVLKYFADGDFLSCMEDWDISTGVVRANSRDETHRAEQGKSALVGLPLPEALKRLASAE